MEESVSTASPEADLPETTGARWDRTDGTAAAVLRVEGTLVATEPLHIDEGGEEEDPETTSDLTLLTDPRSGRPLLPGTTLAGALRAYLRAREHGFPGGESEEEDDRPEEGFASALFGERAAGDQEPNGDGDGPAPSTVTVDDALGQIPDGASIEVYEGNRLAGASRTAEDEALYSRTVWPAGTTFDLHFEMELPVGEERAARYCTALVSALQGLEDERAGIRLGGRKRRGFGRVHAEGWQARCFDLTDTEDFLAWVEEGGEPLCEIQSRSRDDVAELRDMLNGRFGDVEIIPDERTMFFVEAACTLPYGLLDRTAGTTGEPDVAHRRAYDPESGDESGEERPVLTGTQMGGALRARARRIARTIAPSEEGAKTLVESVFGSNPFGSNPDREDDPRAGRLWIDRSFIEGDSGSVGLMDLVQTRIQIAPWTQAPASGALFNEQPVRGGGDVEVTLRWRLDRPNRAEIGLVLHLLKDLWTGDLATAGTQSIGRGRFRGKTATIEHREGTEPPQSWTFKASESGSGLRFTEGDPEDLTRYADALCDHFDEGAE
jgi:CRISPR/Cas system CSM-associated protein Csm3 (group 7 of RAMP superfamily)